MMNHNYFSMNISLFSRSSFAAFVVCITICALIFLPGIVFSQGLVKCWGGSSCKLADLVLTIRAVIDWLLTIAAVIGGVLFAYAGYLYVTSAGNTGQVGQAHQIFWNVLIGIVIAFAAWLIIKSILDALGLDPAYSGLG
jgi:hypothetical protein